MLPHHCVSCWYAGVLKATCCPSSPFRKATPEAEKVPTREKRSMAWNGICVGLNSTDKTLQSGKEKTEKQYNKTRSGSEKINRYYLLGN